MSEACSKREVEGQSGDVPPTGEAFPAGTGSLGRGTKALLLVVVGVGLGLRILWPGTTIFCDDQARACALAQDVAAGHWESAGLINSGHFRNPAGYIYVLAGAWLIWPAPSALHGLTAAVNLAAFCGAAWWFYRTIGGPRALWAAAFFAAAPWAIHYCRWIWAQHLLFPCALLVYLSLWQWLVVGRRWASFFVFPAITLAMEVHLAGVVLALAVVLLLIFWRPRIPWGPMSLGVLISLAALGQYWWSGELRMPSTDRLGYGHIWRAVPGALMSVSGLGWSLEFKGGYGGLLEYLGMRHWLYLPAFVVPCLLLIGGIVTWFWTHRLRNWRELPPRSIDGMVVALVLFIPTSFMLLAVRTSPTYFPMWYPLPFIIIGGAAAWLTTRPHRWTRCLSSIVLFTALFLQLAFFFDQLRYVHMQGGVPESILSRSYGPLVKDAARIAGEVSAEEVWVTYAGGDSIMSEATAYVFRRQSWFATEPRRVLISYCPPWVDESRVMLLDMGESTPAGAYQVHPWYGPAQHGGRIRMVADADPTRDAQILE